MQDCHRRNCSQGSNIGILHFGAAMSLGVQYMCWTQCCKMVKRSLNGTAEHARAFVTVPLVLNPRTGYVSLQFHVVFDDAFSTVPSLYSVEEHDRWFEQLFESSREQFLDPTDVEAGMEMLEDQWLSPDELAIPLEQRWEREAAQTPVISTPEPVPPIIATTHRPHADLPQDRPASVLPSTPKTPTPSPPSSPSTPASSVSAWLPTVKEGDIPSASIQPTLILTGPTPSTHPNNSTVGSLSTMVLSCYFPGNFRAFTRIPGIAPILA